MPSFAQTENRPTPDQAAESQGDIVVTATRRSETALSIPLSITAVSAESLEKKAATTFFDFASTIPNLSFANTSYGVVNSRTIGIRGIADEQTTGFYIDETPVPEAVDPKIFDVERIEVLRGPQGTLYGARSMGGTVRLITTQPDAGDTAGRVHGSLSTTDHAPRVNYQIDGAFNLPVAQDKAAIRISAIHEYESGYIDRQFPTAGGIGKVDNVGAVRTTGVAVAALLKPTEELSITPRLIYQRTKYSGFPFADVAVPDPLQSVSLVPRSLTVQREFDIPESAKDRFLLASAEIRLMKDFGTFTSSSSYFDRTLNDVEDNSLAFQAAFGTDDPLPVRIEDIQKNRIYTQEFRFSSQFGGAFQLVAGLYYNRRNEKIIFPPTIVPDYEALFGSSNAYSANFANTYTEYAAYAEGTLNLTEHVSVTAGLRGFENKFSVQTTTDGVAAGGLNVSPTRRVKENGITPKFSAQYKFDQDAQIYATVAKGFRPGGAQNPITSPLCAANLQAIGRTSEQTATFDSDSVWSYEVGAKGRLLDRKLTASAAAFRIDWQNIQQTVSLPCGFNFRNNAGTARSQGVEVETEFRPTEGLQLGLGFGYTDAKIRKSVPGGTFAPGDRIPQVPKYTLALSGDYELPVGATMTGFLHADYKYVSGSPSTVNAIRSPVTGALAARYRPSYEIVGARAGVRFDDIEIAVFGKNLTNQIASLSDVLSLGLEAPGRARVSINQPRTIGVELRKKF